MTIKMILSKSKTQTGPFGLLTLVWGILLIYLK